MVVIGPLLVQKIGDISEPAGNGFGAILAAVQQGVQPRLVSLTGDDFRGIEAAEGAAHTIPTIQCEFVAVESRSLHDGPGRGPSAPLLAPLSTTAKKTIAQSTTILMADFRSYDTGYLEANIRSLATRSQTRIVLAGASQLRHKASLAFLARQDLVIANRSDAHEAARSDKDIETIIRLDLPNMVLVGRGGTSGRTRAGWMNFATLADDRAGGGIDAFAGALLAGLAHGRSLESAIEWATASAALFRTRGVFPTRAQAEQAALAAQRAVQTARHADDSSSQSSKFKHRTSPASGLARILLVVALIAAASCSAYRIAP